MNSLAKRKATSDDSQPSANKEKKRKQWQTPGYRTAHQAAGIHPGDAGIWATCDKGREKKCIGELRDLFQEYAENLYGDSEQPDKPADAPEDDEDEDEDEDIETEIQGEVQKMRKPAGRSLFTNVRIEVQCVLFFKTKAPIDPVTFVHAICLDALQHGSKHRTRFVKRLTPVTKVGKATESGLAGLATEVLAPHFHTGDGVAKTFAIRPTTRNHDKTLTREKIINIVADAVGAPHTVNLGEPQLTILVEVYKFSCGMSVVGHDFEDLKRFNLSEIGAPFSATIDDGGSGAERRSPDSPLVEAAQV